MNKEINVYSKDVQIPDARSPWHLIFARYSAWNLLHVNLPTPTNFKWFQKDEVHARTDYEGPETKERYSSTFPSTSALDGGERSTPRPGSFTPGKDSR